MCLFIWLPELFADWLAVSFALFVQLTKILFAEKDELLTT